MAKNKNMTTDERKDKAADIFDQVFKKILPKLTVQFIPNDKTDQLERRYCDIMAAMVAGDETLISELLAVATQWGLAVLNSEMKEISAPAQTMIPEVNQPPAQINLFADLQKRNQI